MASDIFTLLVCGGRDYACPRIDGVIVVNPEEYARVERILDAVHKSIVAGGKSLFVIHGDADGADTAADRWAKSRGVPFRAFPADWGRYQRRAGPIRNKQMLTEGKPDAIVALPGGRGTRNMIEQGRRAGVPYKDYF